MIRVRRKLHYSIFISLLRKMATIATQYKMRSYFIKPGSSTREKLFYRLGSKLATQKVALTTVAGMEKYR